MTDTYTVAKRHIDWYPADGALTLPLGRHVEHDSRSLLYPWKTSGLILQNNLLARHIEILDQGQVGACTGNAEEGALGTDPLFSTLPAGTSLNEDGALILYSAAEDIDGDGPYPPNDNGSSGLSVCKAAKNAGLISGFVHCLSLSDVLDAISSGKAVILGINWYDSFDNPDSSGLISISPNSSVRGGHEILARGIDVDTKRIFGDNSWGTGWGNQGSMQMDWSTLERLLAEQGDGTVSIPLTDPAPTPVPVPDPPTPNPTPPPDVNSDDVQFAQRLIPWVNEHHVGGNRTVARAGLAWLKAKGLTS